MTMISMGAGTWMAFPTFFRTAHLPPCCWASSIRWARPVQYISCPFPILSALSSFLMHRKLNDLASSFFTCQDINRFPSPISELLSYIPRRRQRLRNPVSRCRAPSRLDIPFFSPFFIKKMEPTPPLSPRLGPYGEIMATENTGGTTSAQFFEDDAVCSLLAHLDEPTDLLVLGLPDTGKKSLLANLRAVATAATADDLFAAPSCADAWPSFCSPAPAPTPDCGWQLTVNNAQCAAFDLGGNHQESWWRCRRLKQHLQRALVPQETDELLKQQPPGARVGGVLFVVDWEAWQTHEKAYQEMLGVLNIDQLAGVPFAILFSGADPNPDECNLAEYESVYDQWRSSVPSDGEVEVFMGSVEDHWGYRAAFEWLLKDFV
ncbi:uncharacterized protein B0H64DRAFT_470194 [Chaetomium fimeti]|uniref:Uncharacterized protein n=1 Tax=Chaetomium fimeti TaxID=1854472 RepID=A0AAE0LX88_9PEZI|nr:hypothetical protein B0H64DRAFT_470194 [Chaetomium fimeti]